LTDEPEFLLQPRFECIDKRAAALLSDSATFVGAAATDVLLDGIERSDPFERSAGDRRRSGVGEPVELGSDVRPAEGKADVAALGELAIAGVAFDLTALSPG
jgi:hypothetical protein